MTRIHALTDTRPLSVTESVEELARTQGGVVSRAQAYALGLTRGQARAQVAARRWQRVWSRSLCVYTGPVPADGLAWAAVFEGGDRAMLDGVSALVASGLTNVEPRAVRVSVPRGVKPLRGAGLDVRRTRRWRSEDRAPAGVPRTRVEVAAVRAALWAHSDRQAALLVTMAVQQRLTTAERVGRALLDVRRDRRRELLHQVVLDLLGGAESLGEIDFAAECRRRGLPMPTRQALVRGKDGRYHLDVWWEEYGVAVEVDGIHHEWAEAVVGDALRHNEVTLTRAVVLRVPLLGFRIAKDEFLEQVERALAARGWSRAA